MKLLVFLVFLQRLVSSAFKSLDNERILHYAELCNRVYLLDGRLNTDQMTYELQAQGLLTENQKVVLQGFRNGNQLSVIVVKTGRNAIQFLFIGTDSFTDVILDLMAFSTKEHIETCLLNAHPTRIAARIKKRNRTHMLSSQVYTAIDVHKGFKWAGKDFMLKAFDLLRPYIETGFDIYFDINGHSMGGALASQMAYHIKKRLAKTYQIPPEQIGLQVVTFAAAGYFAETDLEKVERVTDATQTMIHFCRINDLARELTELVGYKNPGNWVYMDNFVPIDNPLAEFITRMLGFKEWPSAIAERAKKELANHTISNYIITIKDAIEKDRDLLDGPTRLVEVDRTILTPQVVGGIKIGTAIVALALLYYLATKRDELI